MSRLRTAAAILPLITLSTTALSGCVFYQKPLHGTVVDAETKQPIQGAVVVGRWRPWRLVIPFGSHLDVPRHVAEAVTNSEGEYRLPSWGPVLCWPTATIDYPPDLLAYKSGYEPKSNAVHWDNAGIARQSDWDGETVALTPYRGTPEMRLREDQIIFSFCASPAPLPALDQEILNDRPFLGPQGIEWLRAVEETLKGER
jgi:hypothetical protein